MSEQREPTEEELRAAYEAEVKKIRVEHVLLEQVVSIINLGMRRTGLAPGTEDERDVEQVRVAVESVRAVIPLLEQTAPEQIGPIRQALSQLQLAYVRIGGTGPAGEQSPEEASAAGAPTPSAGAAGEAPGAGPSAPGGTGPADGEREQQPQEGPGPAQRSGRLWVPGQ